MNFITILVSIQIWILVLKYNSEVNFWDTFYINLIFWSHYQRQDFDDLKIFKKRPKESRKIT
jgi:hypothetical protein